jgi:hypothetical protein
MSYELFVQAFHQGARAAIPDRRRSILDVVRPFLVSGVRDTGKPLVTRTADGGTAEFHFEEENAAFSVRRFSRGDTLDLIVRAAASAGLVILGPDLPPALTDATQYWHLPAEILSQSPPPVLVSSGKDLGGLLADDSRTHLETRMALVERLGPVNLRPPGADEAYTRQLRTEPFGPWRRVRELLAEAGIDPTSAIARHIFDGGHGTGNEQGELFEFSGGRSRFRARLRWRYPPGEAGVNDWRPVDR